MDKTSVYPIIGFALAFAGLGVGYFAIYMGIRHDRYKRELEHKERMLALELGRPLPGDISWLSTQRIGFLMGAVVPVCLFGLSGLLTQTHGFHPNIWESSSIVGALAILSGAVLVVIGGANESRNPGVGPRGEKVPVEDDAYDVVSARG